jgi:hypothetical protein
VATKEAGKGVLRDKQTSRAFPHWVYIKQNAPNITYVSVPDSPIMSDGTILPIFFVGGTFFMYAQGHV